MYWVDNVKVFEYANHLSRKEMFNISYVPATELVIISIY